MSERLTALQTMPYPDYLQTPEWRRTRNEALHHAHFRCQRCQRKDELQVHHRTYVRRGAERLEDLEVVCRDCHEQHHFEEGRTQNITVYVALVSTVLKRESFDSLSELTAAVREACIEAKLPGDHGRIMRAIELVDDHRQGVVPVAFASRPSRASRGVVTPDQGIGRLEAAEICRRLGLLVPFRSIPSAPFGTDRGERVYVRSSEDDAS